MQDSQSMKASQCIDLSDTGMLLAEIHEDHMQKYNH